MVYARATVHQKGHRMFLQGVATRSNSGPINVEEYLGVTNLGLHKRCLSGSNAFYH